MNLNKCSGAEKGFHDQIVKTFWGGEIKSERHSKYGYHCDALPNHWREITLDELGNTIFFQYQPIANGWIRTTIGDAFCHFLHNHTGVAFIHEYWEKKVRVFAFGCQHKFKSETIGRCLHKDTCEKCGFEQTVDTSD